MSSHKITNAKGERAIDLACTDCRRGMQQALRQRFEREIGPIISSKDTATNVVTEADLKLFTSLMDAVDPNPRRIKRVVNILQVINSVAHNTLVDEEDVERGFVCTPTVARRRRSRRTPWREKPTCSCAVVVEIRRWRCEIGDAAPRPPRPRARSRP